MATDPDQEAQMERIAQEVWPDVIRKIDVLAVRADTDSEWSARPYSPLAGDDRKSAPYQTSHAIQSLLNAGIDNLGAVRHLIFGRPEQPIDRAVLHQAAHFTLGRAAIANFATGLWILGPNDRPSRVERTLRWHAKNVSDQHNATDRFGIDPGPGGSMETKMLRLEGLLRAANGEVPRTFRRGYFDTQVVQYVDALRGMDPDRALSTHFIWQLCSGFAHGRPWAQLSFLEQEARETDKEDILQIRMTSTLARALVAPMHAVELCEELLDRYERLNSPLFA